LLLTSLAPIGLVLSGALAWRGQWYAAGWLGEGVIILTLVCVAMLQGAHELVPPVSKKISEPKSRESEPLSFLVAYALPLIALDLRGTNYGGLGAFAFVMGLVLWQGQAFHINPLLAALGFHFFGATNSKGAEVLVITRRKMLHPGLLRVARISDYVWLDCPKIDLAKAGDDGPPSSDGQDEEAQGDSA
jgi:hypothetical protein